MAHDFPIDNCPICAQPLSHDPKQRCYYCLVPDPNQWLQNSHYIVFEYDVSEQSVLLGGFLFATNEDENETHVARENDGTDIFVLPRITDWSNPDKLVNKVKTLLVFS